MKRYIGLALAFAVQLVVNGAQAASLRGNEDLQGPDRGAQVREALLARISVSLVTPQLVGESLMRRGLAVPLRAAKASQGFALAAPYVRAGGVTQDPMAGFSSMTLPLGGKGARSTTVKISFATSF